MFSNFRGRRNGAQGGREPNGAAAHDENEYGEVRYRPLLIGQLTLGHRQLQAQMRDVLAACSRRDEGALIDALQQFAERFRGLTLLKATQLFPYVRWGLHNDKAALLIFDSVQLEAQRSARIIEAVLCEYLGAPWTGAHRRRIVADVARMARQVADLVRRDEFCVFPHVLPPGQFRHIGVSAAVSA